PVSSCPILLYTLPPVLPSPLLSPYTPLFRSDRGARVAQHARSARSRRHTAPAVHGRRDDRHGQALAVRDGGWRGALGEARRGGRSEEHTSELQSRENLVCRLLLEKKKYITTN